MLHPMQIDEKWLQREMEYWRIPGMAVVAIRAEEPDVIACLGYRDAEKKLPVTSDTQFCIASCTKAMTAALIAVLVDRGLLDYDVPVRTYIPHFHMKDPGADEQLTLRDILCHRSGIGAHDALWPGRATREELCRRIRYLQPCGGFREQALYSNLMYAMAGYVAEYVTGRPWDELMEEYLFAPLCMKRTTCLAEQITQDGNHAEPYFIEGGRAVKVPFWNVDLAGPAASVNSTIEDMAKWLRFHINRGKREGKTPLLAPQTFAQMHTPHIVYDDNAGLAEDCFPCDSYCQGWLSGIYRGHLLQKHSGKIEGYSTLQAYLPRERVGVAIMMNAHSPSTPIFYTVLYTLLDQMLGYENSHWERKFRGEEEQAPLAAYGDCSMDATAGRFSAEQKGKPLGCETGQLQGIYFDPGYGEVRIYEKEGAFGELMLFYRDQELPLQHWGGSQFFLSGVKEDIWKMKVPVEFSEDGSDDGKRRITGVSIGYEPMAEDIWFRKQ